VDGLDFKEGRRGCDCFSEAAIDQKEGGEGDCSKDLEGTAWGITVTTKKRYQHNTVGKVRGRDKMVVREPSWKKRIRPSMPRRRAVAEAKKTHEKPRRRRIQTKLKLQERIQFQKGLSKKHRTRGVGEDEQGAKRRDLFACLSKCAAGKRRNLKRGRTEDIRGRKGP